MPSSSREFLLTFLLGCSCGVLFTAIYNELNLCFGSSCYSNKRKVMGQIDDTQSFFAAFSGRKDHLEMPPVVYNESLGPIIFNDLDVTHKKGSSIVALELSRKVRVLCWVMTNPKTVYTKGQAVKDTWGKRCNVLVFMSSVEDKKFPVVGLKVPEGRTHLWLKTRAAWQYIYHKHFNDADWFMKVDDDTFLVVENLRHFLSSYNPLENHYFGRWFLPYGGYNSGGAGYVFSKGTLRAFTNLMQDPGRCKLRSFAEDVEVGICLSEEGIHPADTRDEMGRETFHPFAPEYHLIPGAIKQNNWIHSYNKWDVRNGPGCCSDHSISFHYVKPKNMYILEYFIYHLHPYGIHHVH